MASKHTSGYKLCQWEASDEVLRTDFNEDNSKIDAALKALDARALGIPALGRNLYNLFLRQKQAGQDVSWMEGIVYDDFTDRSKIESLGTGMSYSSSEKCVIFTPTDDTPNATMVTKELPLNFTHTGAYVLVRYDTLYIPGVEVWNDSQSDWVALTRIDGTRHEHDPLTLNDHYYECAFFAPISYSTKNIKLRITLRTIYEKTVHLYNYCYMIC